MSEEIACPRCGAQAKPERAAAGWVCEYCGYEVGAWTDEQKAVEVEAREALARGEAGRAKQLVADALRDSPGNPGLAALDAQIESHLAALRRGDAVPGDSLAALSEAEQYHLQATFVLNELQANVKVYGSNSMLSGATPANVDLGLQYIDRSLELFPENPVYLNTKALLLAEGKGERAQAKVLLERAAAAAPRDINIQNNLKAVSGGGGGCFVATAAWGTDMAPEVESLRSWRDRVLLRSRVGRLFVKVYYQISPPLAAPSSETARRLVRGLLRPLVRRLSGR